MLQDSGGRSVVFPAPRQPPQDSPGPAVWAHRACYYSSSTNALFLYYMMLVVLKACPCSARPVQVFRHS